MTLVRYLVGFFIAIPVMLVSALALEGLHRSVARLKNMLHSRTSPE